MELILLYTILIISLYNSFIINKIKNKSKIMAADFTQLTADVAAETTIDTSVETLLTKLVAEIQAAGTDPVALKALTDQMEANATALAAAVANVPA
jgi:hypothetical protein